MFKDIPIHFDLFDMTNKCIQNLLFDIDSVNFDLRNTIFLIFVLWSFHIVYLMYQLFQHTLNCLVSTNASYCQLFQHEIKANFKDICLSISFFLCSILQSSKLSLASCLGKLTIYQLYNQLAKLSGSLNGLPST